MKKILSVLLVIVMAFSMAACADNDVQSGDEQDNRQMEYTTDVNATTLTIMGTNNETVVFDASDLENMGTITVTYSGRNKVVQNARQFETFTGVPLETVFDEAGFPVENATMKVICSDGYTREYDVEDLFGLYAFTDNESDDKTEVVPIIAIVDAGEDSEYPAPFRLVYGQEDYDTYTNETQDYNTQGWASYIQCIQVSYE